MEIGCIPVSDVYHCHKMILRTLLPHNRILKEGIRVHLEEMKKEIEASDAWKKGEDERVVAEELIDVIFYVLDASRLACPSVDMDQMFAWKLEKNRGREYRYGQGHRRG